jgi:hypothetical protein
VQVAVVLVAALTAIGVRGQGGTPAVLVVVNDGAPNPFGAYLPEILRAEGINTFDVVQLSALDAPTLDAAALTILAETPLTAPQTTLLTDYVAAGGRLIAMRPDVQLAPVLGITPAAGSTTDGYLLIDQTGPGGGLQDVTLPFKGAADHWDLSGASTVATLYSTRSLSAARPAVVRHGRTAAWTFDLARSTAYVRQGDPAFAGLDRDGQVAYRTTDIFFQTIDLERVRVPHADVQMRLFSRMIGELLADSQPLPRLWYFPGASRTLLVPTSDSHTSTPAAYAALIDAVEGAGGRLTFYLPRFLDLSGSPIADWVANGHDVGLHPYFTEDGHANDFPAGYAAVATWFASSIPVAPGPTTRHHRNEWGGWVDPVSVMAGHGVRMDLSYYSEGPVLDHPTQASQAHGFITGSGLPMKFVNAAGQVSTVYQQATPLTDEQLVFGEHSQQLSPAQALAVSRQLIDDSQAGGYSAIGAQFQVDFYPFGEVKPWVDGTLAYAASRQVPIWSARRWLAFVEARVATQMGVPSWTPGTGELSFTVAVPAGADPQSVVLPQTFAGRVVGHVSLDGVTAVPVAASINGRAVQLLVVAPLAGGGPRQVEVQYLTSASLPVVSIGNQSIAEGDAGSTPAVLTASLSSPSATDVTVSFGTSNGTAVAGADYQSTSGTLVIPAGATSVPVPVAILGDTVDEPAETIVVSLGNPIGATLGDNVGVITVVDDDPDPLDWTDTSGADFGTCSIAAGTRVASTGDVRLPGAFNDGFAGTVLNPRWVSGAWTGGAIAVAPSGGTLAVQGPGGAFVRSVDPVPGSLIDVRARFAAAPTQALGIADDTFFTRFALFSTLESGTDLWARTDPGTGEIRTNLGPVPAGYHGFAIERLPQGASELVRYSIDGEVVAAHVIPSGGLPEARYVHFSNEGHGTPALEIDEVDVAQPFVSPGTFDSCPVDASQVMTWDRLFWQADAPAGASLAFRARTSIDGVTWSSWSGPLTTSGSPVASPPGRYLQYRIEMATTDLTTSPIVRAVTAAALGPAPPIVSIASATASEGAGTMAFAASLSWSSLQTVSVSFVTGSGTATAGSDFFAAGQTVTFTPGVVARPIAITLVNDVVPEADETFAVTLSAPVNAVLGTAVALGTIVDDDRPPVATADVYTTPFDTPLDVAAPGVLGNDNGFGAAALTAVLVTDVAHGTLGLGGDGSVHYTPDAGFAGTDTFTYRATTAVGPSAAVTVSIAVAAPTTVQPPRELRVSEIRGNQVTFRWNVGPGPVPVGYVLDGGVLPSQTLVSLDTGHAAPTFTVTAPNGSFYVRMRALGVGGPSATSNEVRVHVGVPVAPSAPADLLGTVAGDSLHLAWRPTFDGAAAAGVVLDVSGSLAGAVPLPAVERVSFAGVPPGTYTITARATNAAGTSLASAAVTLTVPAACGGPPEPPANLLAYVRAGTTFVVWDPPSTGVAPTGYLVSVPGIGSLPLAERAISGPLPAGTHTISVHATSACGTGAPATFTLTVP